MKWSAAFVLVIAIAFGGLYFTPLSMKTATWKLRLTLTYWKLLFGMCVVGEKIGIGPFYKNMRMFTRPLMKLRIRNTTDVEVKNTELAGVRAVIYRSAHHKPSDPARPALLYLHGGGWVLGVPEIYQKFYQQLVRELDMVVVAIDYQKAPEYLYPKSFDTCLQAVMTLSKEASSFGIDPKRIAVGGDSAGGNLAAAVISHLHSGAVSNDKTRVAHLILFYPVLQGLDFNLPSYIDYSNEEMLTKQLMIRFWQVYLLGNDQYTNHLIANNHSTPTTRRKARDMIWKFLRNGAQPHEEPTDTGDPEVIHAMQSATSDALTSPILFSDSDLRKLPPVYIVTCEYDVLRDEGWAYAARLYNMKHSIKHEHYLAYHGLLSFYDFGITEAKIMVEDVILYLKKNL